MERLPLRHLAEGLRCFVCGPVDHGMRVQFELVDDHVEGRWVANQALEGWPGLAHGAAFAALVDEAAAWAMIAVAARTGFTTRLEVRYHKPIRMGQEVVARARPLEVGERAGTFAVELLLPDGSLAASGTVVYAFLAEEEITKLLGRRLSPELTAWLRADDAGRRALLRRYVEAPAP